MRPSTPERFVTWLSALLFGPAVEPSTNELMRAVLESEPVPAPRLTQPKDVQ